ncbi:TadE/TadG family type IV pilus assembly protein [Streptomyces sp. NPDC002004]
MTGRRGGIRQGDRGQVTIEFLGMTPLIILTLVLVWQFVLAGYTYMLAGNAADEAVHTAAAAPNWNRETECEQAGRDKLPDAWLGGAHVECHTDPARGYVTANVRLDVPVLFPGSIAFPFRAEGDAGALEEETR